jgi:hypothetical protein
MGGEQMAGETYEFRWKAIMAERNWASKQILRPNIN